jgi:DNA polymerase-3 subunit delta
MAKTTLAAGLTGFDAIERPDAVPDKPAYAVYGDEEFLRRAAIAAIKGRVLGQDADEFGVTNFDGRTASLADVLDELAMLPFFGGRRLVVVQKADDFVSAHRDALERYVQSPARSGVLILAVQSWPSNTRLAKMVAQVGLAIDCKSPGESQLAPWCRRWSQRRYGKKLGNDASQLLVDLVGAGVGQLDSELDKLAAFVGTQPEISVQDVDRLVAAGRVETVWNIIDAAAAGRTYEALSMLDSLVTAGEQPLMIFGAFSAQLRKLARASRLILAGEPMRSALPKVGVPPFFVDKAESQLRHLGRSRVTKIYDWLIETDMGMKGDSMLVPPHLLERLVIRIAAPTE